MDIFIQVFLSISSPTRDPPDIHNWKVRKTVWIIAKQANIG